jgi:hypothetical protein
MPAAIALRAAKRLLGPLIWRETYRCLALPWDQAGAQGAQTSGPGRDAEVRLLEREELRRYSRQNEYEISASFVDSIAGREDLCFGAFVEGRLALSLSPALDLRLQGLDASGVAGESSASRAVCPVPARGWALAWRPGGPAGLRDARHEPQSFVRGRAGPARIWAGRFVFGPSGTQAPVGDRAVPGRAGRLPHRSAR